MIRPAPDYTLGPADPNELATMEQIIQARIDRRISRRDLIRRAAQIGIAAPVVGVMLHATSDMAFGAPRPGKAPIRMLGASDPISLTGPTQPTGTPVDGGQIVMGTNEEPDTLHPYLTQLVTGYDVYSGIVETFLGYDSNEQLFPVLAESYSISDDGLTYTFKLRAGVKFHNGDTLSGNDVVESWKMIMNPDFAAYSTQGWDQITDITVGDDGLTVTMATAEVYAPFLSYVGATINAICPASAIAKGIDSFKQDYGRAPIGTGPMKFTEWKAKEQIVLERFPEYWGGMPKLGKLIFQIVPDDNTQIVQLQTGEVTMVAGAGAFGALRVDDITKIDNVNVIEVISQDWTHLDLKHVDHLRVTKVRQALDFATPIQQIIDQLLKGRVTRSIGDISPQSWAFNPNITPREYNPDQAKQLLTEAGLTQNGDGVWEGPTPAADKTIDPNAMPRTGEVKPLEIELWAIAGSTQTTRVAEVISQAWNQVGIKTTPKYEDVSTIFGPEGFQFTQAMTAGMYSWTNSNDPDDTYYWHSSQIPSTPTGTGGNTPAYFFPFNFQAQIDDLTSAAAKEVDQEKRKQLYWQIQELLYQELPVIFMYWLKNYSVAASNIGGFWPSAFNYLQWNVANWYVTE